MAKVGVSGPGDEESSRLVFRTEDLEKIGDVLRTFLKNVKARGIFLAYGDGKVLSREGDLPESTANLADAFDGIRKTARLLGEGGFVSFFLQGLSDSLLVFRVERGVFLVVVFADADQMGMIRLYGATVASKLAELFDEIARRNRG